MAGIALVHWAYPPTVGGVETHLIEFSEQLVRSGYEVTVLTGTLSDDLSDAPSNVTVHRDARLDLTPTADRTGLHDWLLAKLRACNPDVVHGHNLHHPEAQVAQTLVKLRDDGTLHFRLVHTYHSVWEAWDGGSAWKVMGEWDRHFAVSNFLADLLEKTHDMPRPKALHVGVETSRYKGIPTLPDHDLTTILLPARLDPDKGGEQAVKAFIRVVRDYDGDGSQLKLVLADSKSQVDYSGKCVGYRESLEKLVADAYLAPGQVEFVEAGWEGMPALYERAHIVLCPSTYDEPLGLAALEAMCAARPVISTRVGGLGEAVGGRGDTGPVVRDGDVTDLAKAITRLLKNPGEAANMGVCGRERVVKDFDLASTYLPEMERCYRELGAYPSARSVVNSPVAGQTVDLGDRVAKDRQGDCVPANA